MVSHQEENSNEFARTAPEAPCRSACPAGIDVSSYIRLIAAGRFDEALAVVREQIPFAHICGRACFAPCERACHASLISDPISIRSLKRFVADRARLVKEPAPIKSTGKSAGIVGAGPAGLTAAYYLARQGHRVTVFEALPEPGGMLCVGIPAYRLPREVLRAELNLVEEMGVTIRTNTPVNSIEELMAQGFDAIFLAMGCHKGLRLGIQGDDSPRVVEGVHFLKDVSLRIRTAMERKVAVIGGGSTAMDAARTALRLGAEEVTVIYRRTRQEMPAPPEEMEAALAEGVKFEFLTAPLKIVHEDGGLRLDCIRTRLAGEAIEGRRRPIPVEGGEFSLPIETIIVAIGQRPDDPGRFDLPLEQGETISVDPATQATSKPGVFAGGDVTRGTGSIIEAIAEGRRAADAMDRYLNGQGIQQPELPVDDARPEGFRPIGERTPPPTLPLADRRNSFQEVEACFDEDVAIREAARCLRCDLPILVDPSKCAGCRTCQLRCSLRWEGAFVPAKAKIQVSRLVGRSECEFALTFSDECDGCGICAKYCPYGALTRGRKENP
jgi:NADPH-dependent glutamate synthase beta subunit-like oxidoreductase/Pyruvate/2-oxoacid:ferredoxin oxidoreductase delta subunit